MALPKPECRLGYPRDTVESILEEREVPIEDFWSWMYGQTMSLCEGRSYDHLKGRYDESCGGVAHGPIVYSWDLSRFLNEGIED